MLPLIERSDPVANRKLLIWIANVLLLKEDSSHQYAQSSVSIMYGLCGCKRAITGGYTNLDLSVLKASRSSVVASSKSSSSYTCRQSLSSRAILEKYLMSFLQYKLEAPKNNLIGVLAVGVTAVLIASKFLEAVAKGSRISKWPSFSMFIWKK